ncbi:MAG: glycoprotease, partial [Oscillospiraceae bacterium]
LKKVNSNHLLTKVKAVCVSQKPRPEDGSYMPCFLAGLTFAEGIAAALGVKLIKKSHQEGHICAAIYATNNDNLYTKKHLAFHISGGTTEMLLCNGTLINECIGKSTDLYAGQAVDRLGVKLGFTFPSGVMVSEFAERCNEEINPTVSVNSTSCSLSGLQNKCEKLLNDGKSQEYVCKFCLISIAKTVTKMVENAREIYGCLPVVCAGGVMSSSVIKTYVTNNCKDIFFVDGKYASDNAIGLAILAAREGFN